MSASETDSTPTGNARIALTDFSHVAGVIIHKTAGWKSSEKEGGALTFFKFRARRRWGIGVKTISPQVQGGKAGCTEATEIVRQGH